ncbi:MAG: LysE family transporter [Ignisphaera sp.]|uniref:Lysine transporter LysE n=1 Tax=Ignisphaera aggregans TaxID=334771 RepID=A0A7J3JNL5_9CREN
MNIYTLVIQTLMISPSGALSPGPLTFATMALGINGGWRKGVYVALGHTFFELPYIALIAFFMNIIRDILSGSIGDLITIAGVIIILFFALSLIKDSIKGSNPDARNVISGIGNAFVMGFLFTSLNVFFLLWWLSIGFSLILLALEAGFVGLLTMYLAHIWMDFLWLSLVAEAGKRGTVIFGRRGYRIMLALFGILLLFFGINTVLKRFFSISLL